MQPASPITFCVFQNAERLAEGYTAPRMLGNCGLEYGSRQWRVDGSGEDTFGTTIRIASPQFNNVRQCFR